MSVPMVVRVVLFCTVLSLMRRGEEAAAAAADEETQTDMSAVLDHVVQYSEVFGASSFFTLLKNLLNRHLSQIACQ